MSLESPFETAARLNKVQRLLRLVPRGQTRAEIEQIANTLASWDEDARSALAWIASVRRPSALTWELLVRAARERLTDAEIYQEVSRGA